MAPSSAEGVAATSIFLCKESSGSQTVSWVQSWSVTTLSTVQGWERWLCLWFCILHLSPTIVWSHYCGWEAGNFPSPSCMLVYIVNDDNSVDVLWFLWNGLVDCLCMVILGLFWLHGFYVGRLVFYTLTTSEIFYVLTRDYWSGVTLLLEHV